MDKLITKILVNSAISGEKCLLCTFKVPLHSAKCGSHFLKLPPERILKVVSSNKVAFSIFQLYWDSQQDGRGKHQILGHKEKKQVVQTERDICAVTRCALDVSCFLSLLCCAIC